MKRILHVSPGALAMLLACQSPLWSQETAATPVPPKATIPLLHREVVPAPVADQGKRGSTVHAINEKLVRDLIGILKKTKSVDTFLVTVHALADLGPRAKPAVPAIIINAERLGLLTDIIHQENEDSDEDAPGDFVVEAIAHIVSPKGAGEGRRPDVPTAYPEILPAPRMVRPLTYPAAGYFSTVPSLPAPAPTTVRH